MQTGQKSISLNHLGLLEIAGLDAVKLLQGQLTCQINDFTETRSGLGAHCNPQGKIISFFRLVYFQNAYYLQMPREMIPIEKKALEKYSVFYKVKLTDVSDHFFQYGYFEAVSGEWPEEPNQQLSYPDHLIIREQGLPARWIMITKNKMSSDQNINAWRQCDITNHQPLIYPETSEQFFTHDLELTTLNAINFDKGCYTGQEIIARMHYRGKPKTRLYQAMLSSSISIKRGQELIDTQHRAIIADFYQDNNNQYQVLIVASATSGIEWLENI